MRIILTIFAMLVTLLVGPWQAQAEVDPKFGVQMTLDHEDKHDDRMDLVIVNYTNDTLEFNEADTSFLNSYDGKPYSEDWHYYDYVLGGFQADVPKGKSSMSSISWAHTDQDQGEDDPYMWAKYTIGGEQFYLRMYPTKKRQLITDLELAYHIMMAGVDAALIDLGDAEAEKSMKKNIKKAIKEANKIRKGKNMVWAGLTRDLDQSLMTEPSDLDRPIVYHLVGGSYDIDLCPNDHIAFALGQKYVVQFMSVNNDSDLTGYPQMIVNIYTTEQWLKNRFPDGHVAWWNKDMISINHDLSVPSVAMVNQTEGEDKKVIIMSQGVSGYDKELRYTTGLVKVDVANFKPVESFEYYADGRNPVIAMTENFFVEFHDDKKNADVYYGVGTLDDDGTVQWVSQAVNFVDVGAMHPVALAFDGYNVLVSCSVYDEGAYVPKIRTGTMNDAGAISWNAFKDMPFDAGFYAGAALRNGLYVVVRPDSYNLKSLHYSIGRLNGDSVDWITTDQIIDDSKKFDSPVSISFVDDSTVLVGYEAEGTVWYSLGKLSDDSSTLTFQDWESKLFGDSQSLAATEDGYVMQVIGSDSTDDIYYYPGWFVAPPNNLYK